VTIVQKQCLLAALGCYPHREIDGIWGPKSQAAMERFEREHPGMTLTQALSRLECTDDWWQSVRHWTREEFRCRCGGKHCDGFPAEPSRTLVELVDDIRHDLGGPGIPSSGLRCPVHNQNCGGVSNSRHLTGRALDFMVQGVSAQRLYDRARSDPRTNYTYIIGDGPYVHVDVA